MTETFYGNTQCPTSVYYEYTVLPWASINVYYYSCYHHRLLCTQRWFQHLLWMEIYAATMSWLNKVETIAPFLWCVYSNLYLSQHSPGCLSCSHHQTNSQGDGEASDYFLQRMLEDVFYVSILALPLLFVPATYYRHVIDRVMEEWALSCSSTEAASSQLRDYMVISVLPWLLVPAIWRRTNS